MAGGGLVVLILMLTKVQIFHIQVFRLQIWTFRDMGWVSQQQFYRQPKSTTSDLDFGLDNFIFNQNPNLQNLGVQTFDLDFLELLVGWLQQQFYYQLFLGVQTSNLDFLELWGGWMGSWASSDFIVNSSPRLQIWTLSLTILILVYGFQIDHQIQKKSYMSNM